MKIISTKYGPVATSDACNCADLEAVGQGATIAADNNECGSMLLNPQWHANTGGSSRKSCSTYSVQWLLHQSWPNGQCLCSV